MGRKLKRKTPEPDFSTPATQYYYCVNCGYHGDFGFKRERGLSCDSCDYSMLTPLSVKEFETCAPDARVKDWRLRALTGYAGGAKARAELGLVTSPRKAPIKSVAEKPQSVLEEFREIFKQSYKPVDPKPPVVKKTQSGLDPEPSARNVPSSQRSEKVYAPFSELDVETFLRENEELMTSLGDDAIPGKD